MLRSLALFAGFCVLLWVAFASNDEAVLVLAVVVAGLALLLLRDRARIEALEDRLDALAASAARRAAARAAAEAPALDRPDPASAPLDAPRSAAERPALDVSDPAPRTLDAPAETPGALPEADRPARPPAPPVPRPERPRAAPRPPADPLFSLDDLPPPLQRVWAFATGGNLITRVGLLVLFVAIGLGIRYAVEQGVLSVEVRLGLAAAAGLALVALGWRLRDGTPGFGLTLQGGGVAVLYLTIYSAYALYALLPSLPAIALMGVVAVACGVLAFVQNAPSLALLGVAGGFAAPVLAGTAAGNHVLLLSYYAGLNVGVLGAAWAKGWRSVAVVGFVSTFLTGGLWGGLQYAPELYASVQPFVVLTFAIYLALAVRFALRTAATGATPERALAVDGALVFGLPAATFVLQAGLVEGVVPFGRAWSAAALAAVYLIGAGLLRRRTGVRLLADAFLAIGLAFATLALPLAFERVLVGAMWVLEGAGLVWVGARQRKGWMRAGGLALQAVAAAVLFAEGVLSPSSAFSAETLTGWIVAVGLGLSADVVRRLHAAPDAVDRRDALDTIHGVPTEGGGAPTGMSDGDAEAGGLGPWAAEWWAPIERTVGRLSLGFALFWWTTTAAVHVLDLAPDRLVLAGLLGAAAASAALFLGLGRALRWPALGVAAVGLMPAGWLLWLASLVSDGDAVGWRIAGWAALLGVAALALRTHRGHRFRAAAFVGTVWLAAAVVAREMAGALDGMADVWGIAAVGAVLAAGLALALRLPAGWASDRERHLSWGGLGLAVGVWVGLSWASPGTATPLPTVPPLDPIGLASIAGLLGLLAARRDAGAWEPIVTAAVAGLGFGALTAAVLRAVHALGAAPWTADGLYASSSVQAALAVVWTVLAVVLTLWATRVESRPLWFVGVGVLALVVAKLFFVDLSQAEALVRIGAFLTVGVLSLVIGYRAPLPPRGGDVGRGKGEEGDGG